MNTSGITPLDVRVLVEPDMVEKKTAGGIFLPDDHTEKQQYAQIKATVTAVGVNAWTEAARNPAFRCPKPGDRVLIAKYGGIIVDGSDGKKYRILNDEDVTGLLEEA